MYHSYDSSWGYRWWFDDHSESDIEYRKKIDKALEALL